MQRLIWAINFLNNENSPSLFHTTSTTILYYATLKFVEPETDIVRRRNLFLPREQILNLSETNCLELDPILALHFSFIFRHMLFVALTYISKRFTLYTLLPEECIGIVLPGSPLGLR